MSEIFIDICVEYGVIEDRTSRGLGFCLLGTYPTPKRAEWAAAERLSQQSWDYPLAVRMRTVARTDWRDIPPGAPATTEPQQGQQGANG